MIDYIGIDIGGTNIRIGAINENDDLVFEYKESTFENVTNSEDLYNKIIKLIKMVPNYESIKAIGIGAAGSVDRKLGQIITSKNITFLNNLPLVEKLNKNLNKPIFLENDARVATFAEAICGKGKDKNIVCYITISTGLGGGLVINKEIYNGSNNLGAYFARMILDGEHTSNSLISGTALLEQAREKIIKNFKRNLTVLLLNISSTINPDIIILGGGVLKSKDSFLLDVINSFKEKAHPLAKNTIIETTKFEEPGIIGASILAKYEYNKLNSVI